MLSPAAAEVFLSTLLHLLTWKKVQRWRGGVEGSHLETSVTPHTKVMGLWAIAWKFCKWLLSGLLKSQVDTKRVALQPIVGDRRKSNGRPFHLWIPSALLEDGRERLGHSSCEPLGLWEEMLLFSVALEHLLNEIVRLPSHCTAPQPLHTPPAIAHTPNHCTAPPAIAQPPAFALVFSKAPLSSGLSLKTIQLPPVRA